MRKWFVITGLIVIVFVVLAGVVLGSLNSLIDRNKQYILAQVKEAVGGQNTLGQIDVDQRSVSHFRFALSLNLTFS